MTLPSCGPKAWSKNYPTPIAIAFLARGYQICLVCLKLFHRIYAPLTAGILDAFPSDRVVSIEKMTELDRLYAAVSKALDNLCEAVGLKAA